MCDEGLVDDEEVLADDGRLELEECGCGWVDEWEGVCGCVEIVGEGEEAWWWWWWKEGNEGAW